MPAEVLSSYFLRVLGVLFGLRFSKLCVVDVTMCQGAGAHTDLLGSLRRSSSLRCFSSGVNAARWAVEVLLPTSTISSFSFAVCPAYQAITHVLLRAESSAISFGVSLAGKSA